MILSDAGERDPGEQAATHHIAPVSVDEHTAHHRDEPAQGVGARLVSVPRAISPKQRVLHEIFRIGSVPNEAFGDAVQGIEMYQCFGLECGAALILSRAL